MKRICNVYGYYIENDNMTECPNCGGYSFETVKSEEKSGRFPKKW